MFRKRKISNIVLQRFTHQLATLLNAGLPLLRGLEILAEQESNLAFKKMILQLMAGIESGNTFSESLANYPTFFSSFYLNMVRAGELGGMLGITMDRLVFFQEKMQKIKNKISSILLYPTIVLIATLLIVVFLLIFVIPKFELVFSEALEEQPLPLLTHVLLEISRSGRNHALFFLTTFIFFLLVTKLLSSLESVRRLFDRVLLKIPFLGTLFQKHFIAYAFSTLGTLMLHGVPILEAVELTQKISENRSLRSAMKMIHSSLQTGDSLTYPLKASLLFPPMAISMIAVGEETGQLPEMMLHVATIYEQEVDHGTTQLITLLEPCLILLLACCVGTIVIALFLPLMTMVGGMGH